MYRVLGNLFHKSLHFLINRFLFHDLKFRSFWREYRRDIQLLKSGSQSESYFRISFSFLSQRIAKNFQEKKILKKRISAESRRSPQRVLKHYKESQRTSMTSNFVRGRHDIQPLKSGSQSESSSLLSSLSSLRLRFLWLFFLCELLLLLLFCSLRGDREFFGGRPRDLVGVNVNVGNIVGGIIGVAAGSGTSPSVAWVGDTGTW